MPYLPIESQSQDTKASVTEESEANVPPIEMLPEIALLEGRTEYTKEGESFLPSFLPSFQRPVNWGFLTAATVAVTGFCGRGDRCWFKLAYYQIRRT